MILRSEQSGSIIDTIIKGINGKKKNILPLSVTEDYERNDIIGQSGIELEHLQALKVQRALPCHEEKYPAKIDRIT
jgi:hypothetical protein